MSRVLIPSDLIEKSEAADLLGLHYTTIHNMIRRGELTGYQVSKGSTKVSLAEVQAHVKVSTPGPIKLAAAVQRVVDAAPSLTAEQMERLRALLSPTG